MIREIVLDTETTGLDPRRGHRLVEIGCVELINHFPSGKTWHEYINPQRDMPEEAYNIHGISSAFLADKPLFRDLADGFLEFIQDATLIIHNATFDVGFLNHELEQVRRPTIGFEAVIDTLAMARRKHPGSPSSLDALCKRYRIDNSSRTKHGALLDSELLAEVYIELIGGQQARMDLAGQEQQAGDGPHAPREALPPRPRPLGSRLSEAEVQAHQAFIDTLGEHAIWRKGGA